MVWLVAEVLFASASAAAWIVAAFTSAPHTPSFYGKVPDWFVAKQRRAALWNSAGALLAASAMIARVAGLLLGQG